jgi:hypothetical protein
MFLTWLPKRFWRKKQGKKDEGSSSLSLMADEFKVMEGLECLFQNYSFSLVLNLLSNSK